MVKCAVCGSENEPQALFCGTCGSPMPQAAPKPPEPEVVTPAPEPVEPDGTVTPGMGYARRDLGIDTATVVTPPPDTSAAAITDSDGTSGGPTITCSVCGTVNDANRTYCRKCANELKPAAAPPPPPPPPAPVRKISPLALGLGAAAVVVAIALVAVLAMGGGPTASASPSSSAGQSPAAASLLPTTLPSAVASGPAPSGRVFNVSEGKITGTIAFSRCPSDGSGCVIYIRKADGSAKAIAVTSGSGGSAFSPAMSYNAKQIIYSVEPGLRVVTISSRSWVSHSKGPGDTDAVWSPNGKQVAFAGHRDRDTGSGKTDLELRIDGATSGTSVALTSNEVPDIEPYFTPDGKSIVWVQGDKDQAELKMIDIASKTVTDLTTDSFEDHEPAVSPDGTLIAFVSNRGGGDFQLYLMDLASPTHDIIPIATGKTNVRHPAWSPGGRYIVFSAGAEGSEDLFIYDLNASKLTTFTSSDGADLSPTWH
ncbi:MAG TPA: zinc ribbon domain-containing protein [Candidatus Limnocylindrales bacterium]|nr:zinc ribbon domain-containing protein [Candidatus Limnocylindrales bacterium]